MAVNTIRALDAGGNFAWGNGTSNYLTANAQVAENIQRRLNTFYGECFFNTAVGVNWFTYFGTMGQNNILQMNLAISSVIANTTDVLNIVSYTTNLNTVTRQIVISYTVNTVYGTNSGQATVSLPSV